MSKFLTVLTLIAASMLASAVAQSQEGNQMNEDQKNVLAVIERMTGAFQKGDIETVMATYEPSAVVAFEPGIPISDPAILREMFQGASTVNPQFSYSGHEVIVAGDIAVHFAPWTMTGTAPDGTEIAQSGLSVAVLRRQAGSETAIPHFKSPEDLSARISRIVAPP